ncbi:MAG: diadenylate cyclase CdaA, partial [Candidatus Lernaella stagnicola]|nr:diadenylate cyclase CdaA [Candidatus Lernaella stagnicola]
MEIFDTLKSTFSGINLIDLLDIFIVAFIIYRLLVLIQGTRALQILVGLVVIIAVFLMSNLLGFYTLNWILSTFLGSLILVVVVLFQPEIRRTLARFARNPFAATSIPSVEFVEELVRSTTALTNRRIGALIVLERETGLNEYVEEGIQLDAGVSRELIVSVFLPSSPIHDGAVIIRAGRIVAAGCFFPLASDVEIDKDLGTRHRAGLGVSQETDALVLIISEEKAQVSVA